MYSGPTYYFKRHSWMRHSIRGWRLEIELTLGTLALFEVAKKIAGPIGPDVLGIAFVTALLALPRIRNAISHRMLRNRDELQLQGVIWTRAVVGRSGSLPTVRGIRILPRSRSNSANRSRIPFSPVRRYKASSLWPSTSRRHPVTHLN